MSRILRGFSRLFGAQDSSGLPKGAPYTPLPKHYLFNETGTIMLCTTDVSIKEFHNDVKDAFTDITVFFAAMSKALNDTINKETGKPYSIYNYQAVKNILGASEMFIEVNVEERLFESKHVGETLGKEFLQQALHRDFGDNPLSFTRGMFNGMSFQSQNGDASHPGGSLKMSRGGCIIFICEILMGIPQVSAIQLFIEPTSCKLEAAKNNKLVTVKDDASDAQDALTLGAMAECNHTPKGRQRCWRFKKRSYLFVPPKYLSNNAGSLNYSNSESIEGLVNRLKQGLE